MVVSPDSVDVSKRSFRWHGYALALVMVVAATLRFSDVTQVGIRFDDEASYAADARLWHRCARLLVDGQAIDAIMHRDKAGVQSRMTALGIDFSERYIKPSQGFTFLAAGMMFVIGDDPTALVVLNALCGTLSVWLLYQIGVVMFGRSAALGAAALLAISPYHLTYCRSAFPYATATMFVLLGVWWWSTAQVGLREWRRYLLSGMAFGCAAACHYSSLSIAALLFTCEFACVQSRRSAPRTSVRAESRNTTLFERLLEAVRPICTMALGLTLPLLMIEGLFQSVIIAARVTDSYLPVISYFEACSEWADVIVACGVRAAETAFLDWRIPGAYAGYFTHWHGAVASAMLLLGIGFVMFQARGRSKLPAIVVVGTVMLLMLQRYTIPRAAALAVPFACLCIAAVLRALVGAWGSMSFDGPAIGRRVFGIAITIVLFASAIPGLAQAIDRRSGLSDACAFVSEQGGGRVIAPVDSCNQSKYALYLSDAEHDVVRKKLHLLGSPEETLAGLLGGGARWMIADPQHWHYRDPQRRLGDSTFEWWERMYELLDEQAVLAATFEHQAGSRWEFLAEGSGLRFLEEMEQRGGGSLRVYDLQEATRSVRRSERASSAHASSRVD